MGFRLNCLLLSANAPPSAVLAGPWVVWMEKQLLQSVTGDGAAAVAELGLVARIHHLGVVSCILWPGRAQGSLVQAGDGTPLKSHGNT